jgi:putative tryptophan/tyrosine transport system substrate-binding protein
VKWWASSGHTRHANDGKRLGLLRDIVPKAAVFGLLVNPSNPNADPDAKETQTAADALGRQLEVLKAARP